jgi:hypothetical protein
LERDRLQFKKLAFASRQASLNHGAFFLMLRGLKEHVLPKHWKEIL